MPTFRTSDELTRVYAVSAERLHAYAARGNLAMCRRNGETCFDERRVAKLFPRRHGTGVSLCEPHSQPGLGTLGLVRLGEPPSATD